MQRDSERRPVETGGGDVEKVSNDWGGHPKTGLAVALLQAGRSAPEDATTTEIVTVATKADQQDRHPGEIWRGDDVSG
jgi:hypothetical protein